MEKKEPPIPTIQNSGSITDSYQHYKYKVKKLSGISLTKYKFSCTII